MKRILLSTGIVLGGCGEDHGPPFVCDALEREVPIERGRRPSPMELRRPLQAGDRVPTYVRTPMDREPPESLAYRAAVLGCLLGLDEVPGSIRTWAEKTEGKAPPQLVEPPTDPWGIFEVDGVEIYIPKLSADEERGWGLIARRDRPVATLDVLPDEVGFPIARELFDQMVAYEVANAGNVRVPPSYAERPPLSPLREEAGFLFGPHFHGFRLAFLGTAGIRLGADGSPVFLTTGDYHIDEGEPLTIRRGEVEAANASREDIPDTAVIERDEPVYFGADQDLLHWLIYTPRPGAIRHVRFLSLTTEGAEVEENRAPSGWDTSSWW
jgi:hypothetical protein